MYEHHRAPLAPPHVFMRRVIRHLSFAFALIAGSLLVGVLGYRFIAHMMWIDAFLNAAMLLGGMGPTGPELQTNAAKIFAGIYALYAGMLVLVAASILIAPIFHRFIHRFHLAQDKS